MASPIEPDKCYLCHGIATEDEQFAIDPCSCTGTNKVHIACLNTIRDNGGNKCTVCKAMYRLLGRAKLSEAELRKYREKAGNDPPLPPFYSQGRRFNGVHRTYYKDGTTYEEKTYIDGILNGRYRTYYSNGGLEFDLHYVDGLQEGINLMYYRSGEIYFEAPVVNSLRHGLTVYYYPSGKPKIECMYNYGEPSKTFNTYDVNGNLKTLDIS
jgi:hypothetical protein